MLSGTRATVSSSVAPAGRWKAGRWKAGRLIDHPPRPSRPRGARRGAPRTHRWRSRPCRRGRRPASRRGAPCEPRCEACGRTSGSRPGPARGPSPQWRPSRRRHGARASRWSGR
ncbi:hypothetical protein D3273_24620 [Lichenibacterium minor]|uniref:Uncharacterized protein n=1 Tax=Lichenibacterium minor TaxID=2316528 RepID=A0A4Q2U0W6_9HYPH|nr:hypothetical protein D3273_24620 [Lichenibacterium minor]